MNIVVLLFLQCGTNHRDCFQSAYCEASIGHSAGYESEALFYHSAKIRASASDWMLLCIIIQQRTARTSVYIMILTYLLTYPLCAKDDTRSRATKKTPLMTVAGNNLCPSLTLQCHSRFSFFFSLHAFRCSLGVIAFFPAVPEPKSEQFWYSICYSFGDKAYSFPTPPFVLDSGIVAVFSYSCLFDILSGNCSSRFSEGIFDGTPQASHIFRWFSRVQSSKVTLP